MASRKNGQVELHHEVNVKRRVGDVRPWGIKMQEWLSEPFNFAFATLPFILVAIAAPFLPLPVIVLCLVAHLAVMSIKNVLPYRSEEHTSELQSLMRISYAVFCLKKKKNRK